MKAKHLLPLLGVPLIGIPVATLVSCANSSQFTPTGIKLDAIRAWYANLPPELINTDFNIIKYGWLKKVDGQTLAVGVLREANEIMEVVDYVNMRTIIPFNNMISFTEDHTIKEAWAKKRNGTLNQFIADNFILNDMNGISQATFNLNILKEKSPFFRHFPDFGHVVSFNQSILFNNDITYSFNYKIELDRITNLVGNTYVYYNLYAFGTVYKYKHLYQFPTVQQNPPLDPAGYERSAVDFVSGRGE